MDLYKEAQIRMQMGFISVLRRLIHTSERARSHQSLVDADVILHIWGVFTERA